MDEPVARPIMFSTPMVQAILAGHKTQTRRLVTVPWRGARRALPYEPYWVDTDGRLFACDEYGDYHPAEQCMFPYGDVGDRLWVRETHCFCPRSALAKTWSHTPEEARALYRADGPVKLSGPHGFWAPKWRPAIHMPRWASRIALEVLAIRVQRLQEISEADAKAEGVEPMASVPPEQCVAGDLFGRTFGSHPYTAALAVLWDTINANRWPDGAAAWAANPWVWVVSFQRVAP